jgi:hypothetical protein
MFTIILEGVLFAAFIAAVAALFYLGLRYFTPLGPRLAQSRNRRRISTAAARTCPTHGPHDEHQMVRLKDGALLCPECYTETIHGLDE